VRAAQSRYGAYRDSGIEWLGDIPVHWSFVRIKNVITKITSGVTPRGGAESYVDVGIPFLRSQNVHNDGLHLDDVSFISSITHQEMKNSQVKPGDIVFNITGASIARTCIVPGSIKTANISQHIALLKLTKSNETKFISYYLQSQFVNDYVYLTQSGASKEAFNHGQMKCIPLALPPRQEQTAIASYLDTKTAQIDRKIDLLSQKAAQYGKLKQSIINVTVTRGLDKTVEMKDSGVEWIGQVPEHWDIRRLKELSDIQNSNVDKKSHEHETPVQLCNYVDVYKNEFINASLNFMPATADASEIKRFTIKKNDVLITKDSETCDDIAIPGLATESLDGVLCGYHLAQFRVKNKVLLGAYLFRLFQSKSYGFRFVISAKGITRVGLGQSAIADSLTPVPPLSEQQAIANYLDEKTAHIDRIVVTIDTQIDKLKELRKALINDIVTGKIKITNEVV
jgi:type I restriction enzyme S subunit